MPERDGARPRLQRRDLGALGSIAAAALLGGDAARRPFDLAAQLRSDTVALTAQGRRSPIPPGRDPLPPRTRLLPPVGPDSPVLASEQSLLAAADAAAAARGLPAAQRELLTSAALDLHVLSYGLAAPVAGWSGNWRYVWPRDTAHVAVAFARLGQTERACAIVRELARLCGADGWFQARYRPASLAPPDDRPRQLDGTGWFLWALTELTRHRPGLAAEPAVREAASRCAALLLDLTASAPHLPPPSPDYWEVRERRLTVATAALVLVGLERASELDLPVSARAAERARLLRAGIVAAFGPDGYGRYAGRACADAGMLFLLPPYTREPVGTAAELVGEAQARMARAAGGVAPGESWKRDGISWTPETALFAQAWREIGADDEADALLAWLSSHRTPAGSLPEKVLADGSPAAVAPLAWTAALVVTTLLPS